MSEFNPILFDFGEAIKPNFENCVRFSDNFEFIYLAFNEYYAEYRKELRSEGGSIDDFKQNTVRDYLIKSAFFYQKEPGRSDYPVTFKDRRKRALLIDVSKLPDSIKERFEDLKAFFKPK